MVFLARGAREEISRAAPGWVFTAGVIVTMSPRVYYLPAFPLMFAAGRVMWEFWLEARQRRWLRVAFPALLFAARAILAPLATPVLAVETYIRYTRALHLSPPAIETHRLGPLPQMYADQFGWPEMVVTVARVYSSLPPDVRSEDGDLWPDPWHDDAIDLFERLKQLFASVQRSRAYTSHTRCRTSFSTYSIAEGSSSR